MIDSLENVRARRVPRVGWGRAFFHVSPAVVFALVPKCPFCLAAYASALGVGGFMTPGVGASVRAFAEFLLAMSVGLVWWSAIRQPPRWPAAGITVTGVGLLLTGQSAALWPRVLVAIVFGLFVLCHVARMRLPSTILHPNCEGNRNG